MVTGQAEQVAAQFVRGVVERVLEGEEFQVFAPRVGYFMQLVDDALCLRQVDAALCQGGPHHLAGTQLHADVGEMLGRAR